MNNNNQIDKRQQLEIKNILLNYQLLGVEIWLIGSLLRLKKKKKDKSWRCCSCLVPDKQDTQWVFKTFLRVTAMHDVLHFREHASVIFSCNWSSENTTFQIVLQKKKSYFYHKEVESEVFFFSQSFY